MGLKIWGSRAKYNIIEDSGGYYTSDKVEGALQGIGSGAAGGIHNIVEDLTPQLGGNLDANGFVINADGGININANNKNLNIGAGNEFQIYYNGTNVYIKGLSGNLIFTSASSIYLDNSGGLIIRDGTDLNATVFNFNAPSRTFAIGTVADPIITTFNGNVIIASGKKLTLAQDPVANLEAATKQYVDNRILVSGKLWGSYEGIGYFKIEDSSSDYVSFKVIIPDGNLDYYVKFIASWDVSPAAAGAIDSYYQAAKAGELIYVKPNTNNEELTIADATADYIVEITKSIGNAVIETGDILTVILDANLEDIGGQNLKIHGAYLVVQ